MSESIKVDPDATDEVWPLGTFQDRERCIVTPVALFDPVAALAVVEAVAGIVRRAHGVPAAGERGKDGVVRAQQFEEGQVYMLAAPAPGFCADRYLMDFYDVGERGMCSRMHLHTGLRFVRLMTGPQTEILVSSLSPFQLCWVEGVTPFQPEQFTDDLPDPPPGEEHHRYNLIVPPNAWVDLQIPRATSHQFNASGRYAVADSVHPEEDLEVGRERMGGRVMAAQTVFLADTRPSAASCVPSRRGAR
ncbi:hypothetical protein ACGFJT_41960 [Actinomadura geliboluensis]|uniref:hypothetical protein n=1 Tax=Actinomadura geliboluensis TaxID=882440 RepID=UPI003717AF0F